MGTGASAGIAAAAKTAMAEELSAAFKNLTTANRDKLKEALSGEAAPAPATSGYFQKADGKSKAGDKKVQKDDCPKVEICVESSLSGELITTVEVGPKDTIQSLRVAVEAVTAPNFVRLFLEDKTLEDSITIAESGLHDKGVVKAFLRKCVSAQFRAEGGEGFYHWVKKVTIKPGGATDLTSAQSVKQQPQMNDIARDIAGIKEFCSSEILAEIESTYMENGCILGAGALCEPQDDYANFLPLEPALSSSKYEVEELLTIVRDAGIATGFSYEHSRRGRRDWEGWSGFTFLLAGHLLFLEAVKLDEA